MSLIATMDLKPRRRLKLQLTLTQDGWVLLLRDGAWPSPSQFQLRLLLTSRQLNGLRGCLDVPGIAVLREK